MSKITTIKDKDKRVLFFYLNFVGMKHITTRLNFLGEEGLRLLLDLGRPLQRSLKIHVAFLSKKCEFFSFNFYLGIRIFTKIRRIGPTTLILQYHVKNRQRK